MDTLHSENQRGGVFVVTSQDHFWNNYNRTAGYVTNCVNKMFNNGYDSVFVTLNSFLKVSENNMRHEDNLWGLDTVMVDIDADISLVGNEQNAFNILSWYWDVKGTLPKPTLCSFTGGGGMHLYYAFNRVPASAKNSVKKLKTLLIKTVQTILNTDKYFKSINEGLKSGMGYHVDTMVIDNQRFDRIPGSINPKTKKMCICFKVNDDKERYELRDLINFLQSNDDIEEFLDQKSKIIKLSNTLPESRLAVRLNKKRVAGLFELQKRGKDFVNCRESAIFILTNSLRGLGYTKDEIRNKAHQLNNGFYKPLNECEINANLNQSKIYKFTNEKITSMLGLTDKEQLIMFSRKRPGDRKERTKRNKVNISKLVIQGKTISEIAKILNISESIVKHMRVAIKKEKGFFFWAAECCVKTYKRLVGEFLKTVNGEKNNYSAFFKNKSSFCNILNILPKGIINKITKYFSLSDYNKIITEDTDKKIDFRCTKGLVCA